jgi:hypothetical protein
MKSFLKKDVLNMLKFYYIFVIMKQRRKPTKRTPETHQKNGNRKDYKAPSQIRAAKLKTPNNKIPGRPSNYPNVNKKKVFQYYLLGLTDEEVGALLDPPVSKQTIDDWKKKYPEFLATITAAKEGADSLIVKSMFSRAVGHKVNSEKIFLTRDGKIKRAKIIEYYPPDVNAGKYLLNNRQPKLFKEHPEQNPFLASTGDVHVHVVTDKETLKKLRDDEEAARDKS